MVTGGKGFAAGTIAVKKKSRTPALAYYHYICRCRAGRGGANIKRTIKLVERE
jgi:hypothetical protein